MKTLLRNDRGQSMIEFAMILPLMCVIVLGVVEVSYALIDQHVVTKLTREGSNLISRDLTLKDAATVLQSMATRPVNFDSNAKVIFSVIRKGQTTGTANYGVDILYQRYEYGTLAASSALQTRGAGNFNNPPEYTAANADSNTNLQLVNLPSGLNVGNGSMIYVTEVFTRHQLITPFDRFGIKVPDTLYSIAYF